MIVGSGLNEVLESEDPVRNASGRAMRVRKGILAGFLIPIAVFTPPHDFFRFSPSDVLGE